MPVPEEFLRTVDSIQEFASVMLKVKEGTTSQMPIKLNRKECQSLIWGLQLLKEGERRG